MIEMHHLKNVFFIQTILSFMLSRKIINTMILHGNMEMSQLNNLFGLLNTICNLQQLRIPLIDFFNLVLVCSDNVPR